MILMLTIYFFGSFSNDTIPIPSKGDLVNSFRSLFILFKHNDFIFILFNLF